MRSYIGDPMFSVAAVVCVGVVFYLVGLALRENRMRHKRCLERQRQRRGPWGYM